MFSYRGLWIMVALAAFSVSGCLDIGQMELSGQDVADLMGITAGKFSFLMLKPTSHDIACWIEVYDRGVMEPREIVNIKYQSAILMGDVIVSLGRILEYPNEETIPIYLGVQAWSTDEGYGSTWNRVEVENFFQGMHVSSAYSLGEVETGEDIE